MFETATSTGMRPIKIDLDTKTEKLREEIRAEVAALKVIPREARDAAIAEGGWVNRTCLSRGDKRPARPNR